MCMNAFPEEEIGCHIPVDKINGAWDASEWVYGTPSEHLMRLLCLKKLLVCLSSGLWPLQKKGHVFFCCVLAQDLSIFASLNVQAALTVGIKPLKALCAHPTIKKAALVDMKVTSIERKPCVRSYYYDCFCSEVVSANDWTNWKEFLNLANFNLIGWYTVLSAKNQNCVYKLLGWWNWAFLLNNFTLLPSAHFVSAHAELCSFQQKICK